MREQILDSFTHRDFDIMVVGNKYDLVSETNVHSQVSDILDTKVIDKVTPRQVFKLEKVENGKLN